VTKVTAGVLAGFVLGALHGLWSARGDAGTGTLVGAVLGRASQGIINGILAAYMARGQSPVWRGALWGAVIGAVLGALRAIAHHAWAETIPPSAIVGLGCGVAAALARRPKAAPRPAAGDPGAGP
jgi:hypothetical protein